MDVERIQKINNLALELMKQGLATDREAAIAEAEKIFSGGKEAQEYNEMRDTLQKVEADRNPRPVEQQPVTELSADRISEILQKNTQYIVSQLKGFQEKLQMLQQDVETIKTKMNYQKLPTGQDIRSQSPRINNHTTAGEAAKSFEEQKKEIPASERHPRVGGYETSDVSIEKFFYMGSK